MNRLKPMIGAAALALAACGGRGDGLTELQLEDRAASASVAGLIAFAGSVIATLTNETAEPRPIDGITPPTTDTDEPVAL